MENARVAMLTGAAGGIGKALASEMVRRGDRLLATDVDLSVLHRRAEEGGWPSSQVRLRQLDVRDAQAWSDAVQEVVEAWGRLDVMLNVAGYLHPGWIHEMDPGEIDRHIDINTKGVIHGTQAAARHMVARGEGHIVNIASMAALAPIPGIALYSASKFAVRAFSLAVAEELRPHGVWVSVVCPDAVQTAMLEKQVDFPEAALTFSGPRALKAEEVVAALLDQALARRRLEVILPRHRGWLAKLSNLWPTLAHAVVPRLSKQGAIRQAAAVEHRRST